MGKDTVKVRVVIDYEFTQDMFFDLESNNGIFKAKEQVRNQILKGQVLVPLLTNVDVDII